MSGSLSNIESIARAICKRQIKLHDTDTQRLGAEVDRYWHCVAAELEAGLINENGDPVPKADPDFNARLHQSERSLRPWDYLPNVHDHRKTPKDRAEPRGVQQ